MLCEMPWCAFIHFFFLIVNLRMFEPRSVIQELSLLLYKNSLLKRSIPFNLPAPVARGPSAANKDTSGGKTPVKMFSNSDMVVTISF